MILKREAWDDRGRRVTRWAEGIATAERHFDEQYECDVLFVTFTDKTTPPETILLENGEGAYLCNNEGRTISVLGRLCEPPHL